MAFASAIVLLSFCAGCHCRLQTDVHQQLETNKKQQNIHPHHIRRAEVIEDGGTGHRRASLEITKDGSPTGMHGSYPTAAPEGPRSHWHDIAKETSSWLQDAASVIQKGEPELSASSCPTEQKVKTFNCMLVCIVFGSVLALVLRWAHGCNAVADKEVPMLDNAKFVAIALVAFCHWQNLNMPGLAMFKSMPADPFRSAFNQLGSAGAGLLMMPSFTFVSGICSTGRPTKTRIRRVLVSIFLAAMLWALLLWPSWRVIDFLFAALRGESPRTPWTQGEFLSWWSKQAWDVNIGHYLIHLGGWRLIAYAAAEISARSHMPYPATIAFFVGIGLLVSCTVNDTAGNSPFYPQEFLGMFPLFAIGTLVPMRELLQLAPTSRPGQSLGALLLLLWCAVRTHGPTQVIAALTAWEKLPWRGDWNQEIWPYKACPMTGLWAWNLCKCTSWALMVMVFLVLLCPREKYWFSEVGKYSLHVYLLHFPAQHIISGFASLLPYPVLNVLTCGELAWGVVYVISAMAVVVLSLVLTSKPVRMISDPILQPVWLGNLIFGVEQSEGNGGKDDKEPVVCLGDVGKHRI